MGLATCHVSMYVTAVTLHVPETLAAFVFQGTLRGFVRLHLILETADFNERTLCISGPRATETIKFGY